MMALGAYAVFLIAAIAMTLKVALVLRRHGNLLLQGPADRRGANGPDGEQHIRSINRVTLLGFSLVMAGAVALLLRVGGDPRTLIDALAFLATRIGVLLVILGIAHFRCLSVLARASEVRSRVPVGRTRPRQAKEDPLDRVFEPARLDAPFGG